MTIDVMNRGDEVLSVTGEFVAIKRENGEVDIIPLWKEGSGWRVDTENMITIGYGENIVTYETEDGVWITNF